MIHKGPRTKNITIEDSDDDFFADDSEDIATLSENYVPEMGDNDLLRIIDEMGDDANLLFDPSWEKDVNK